MTKKLETRECQNCHKIWTVEVENPNSSIKRILCDNCLQSLSPKEKAIIYGNTSKTKHFETRTCLNCNKQWQIIVSNDKKAVRKQQFCKDCNKLLSNKEKKRILRLKVDGYHEKEKEQRKQSHKRNIIHNMYKRAKDRAKKYNYEFNLEEEDIIIPELCPLLEVPFVLGEKGDYAYTPTIDRIDNSKGYTKDNISIITMKANSMKNSASFEELQKFCTNILRYSLNNKKSELIELKDKEPLG